MKTRNPSSAALHRRSVVKADPHTTSLAQLAERQGPNASERPPYDSSPDGLAFQAGLWAKSAGIHVEEAYQSRGYTVVINGMYAVNLKGKTPEVKKL